MHSCLVCLDMYTSQDDHDMAMEQITERITADVMQEMGADWWDSVKKGVSKAQTAVSNKTSNYRTRVLSLQEQIHEHVLRHRHGLSHQEGIQDRVVHARGGK